MAGAETVLSSPMMTAMTPKVRPGPGWGGRKGAACPRMRGNTRSHSAPGSERLGIIHPPPQPHLLRLDPLCPPPTAKGSGRGCPGLRPFPRAPGGQPSLAPAPQPATVGRSQSAAAQSRPLAARRIAAPPRPIQRAGDARFPPAQSTPGPAPRARGLQPTPTMYPPGFHGFPPPTHAARPSCGRSLQHPPL